MAVDHLHPAGSDDPLPPQTQWFDNTAHQTHVICYIIHSTVVYPHSGGTKTISRNELWTLHREYKVSIYPA